MLCAIVFFGGFYNRDKKLFQPGMLSDLFSHTQAITR